MDTVIDNPRISSLHCKIWREFDPAAPNDASVATVMVEDISTNGTFVRRAKVGKGNVTILFSGDEISIGPTNAQVEAQDDYSERNSHPSSAQ